MADLVRGVIRGTTVRSIDGAILGTPLCASNYSPTDGDAVMVIVDNGVAYVTGKAATMTTAATSTTGTDGDPTPPPAASSGTLHMPATQTGSYRAVDGWGHTGSRLSMSLNAVVQGTAPGSTYAYSGAAFYAAQANQLAGATWDAVRLRIGPRLEIGSNNSALTLHVYVHTSSAKPSGDVSRVAGPYDFTVAAHAGGGWVGTLPSGCYATLAANGGIGITGSPYMGFAGLDVDAASFQLDIDWHR